MKYIVLDMEWNGAYSKKAHGYFNEIIEIGAVALDETMQQIGTFHRVIQPVVSKKLSSIVKELTHITQEELDENGSTFAQVTAAFSKWAGEDAAILTWSNTDLLVLMENFTFFTGDAHVPFMAYYADIQPFCQKQMGVDMSQQMGLSRACEHLGINADDSALHRALDDSLLTAQVFQKLFDEKAFKMFLRPANDEFYARILYKPTIIDDINHPLIKRSELNFACPECGKNLHRKTKWSFYARQFCSDFVCRSCDKNFVARVQFKQTYDGVIVKRKIKEKVKKTPEEAAQPEESENS